MGSLCSFDGSVASPSAAGSGPAAFLNSAALPKENARRSLEVLLLDLRLIAARCFAAGLSALGSGEEEAAGFWSPAKDPVSRVASPAIVAGRESGDGLWARLTTSADGRRPGFIDLCCSCPEVWLAFEWFEPGRLVGDCALRLADWLRQADVSGVFS